MSLRLPIAICAALLCSFSSSRAELARVEILKTEPFSNGYEMVTATAHFTLDPRNEANLVIADLALAPRNSQGRVEASADLVMIQPIDAARSNGTVLFEVSNRGGFTALSGFNGSPGGRMIPGNEFLMRQGYTLAWVGWQFGLAETARFRLQPPVAPVRGMERWYALGSSASSLRLDRPGYCSTTSAKATARLYRRSSLNAARELVAADNWEFPDPCTIHLKSGFEPSKLYELVYEAENSPLAGVGLAVVRDFVSWMKTIHKPNAKRAIGVGYSQSARFLRQFLYDGFNADERGRIVFDGLLLAAAGAGRGSFNHRFADPGVAGNSVEGFDEPVDIFPFTDSDQTDPISRRTDSLLRRAAQQKVVPKIFHMVSSTEYWARVASLAHTSVDGKQDLALPASSRFYFFPGTQHSGGAIPPSRQAGTTPLAAMQNPYSIPTVLPAMLTAMQAWLVEGTEPPSSRYPRLAAKELVPPDNLRANPRIDWPNFVPPTTRLDFGPDFDKKRIITAQPPVKGSAYTLLVPQVDADGNEIAGVKLPHVAVPLATYTGWNRRAQPLTEFGKLAGLSGSYIPFTWTAVSKRYTSKESYLQQIRSAAEGLVRERFLLAEDVARCVEKASREWDWRASIGQ